MATDRPNPSALIALFPGLIPWAGGSGRAGPRRRLALVFVVAPHPIHGAGFVAAHRHDIENHVGAEHFFAATAIAGIGVEDVAVDVLVEHAAAGQLLDSRVDLFVVVLD